jgi:hypothetical protein
LDYFQPRNGLPELESTLSLQPLPLTLIQTGNIVMQSGDADATPHKSARVPFPEPSGDHRYPFASPSSSSNKSAGARSNRALLPSLLPEDPPGIFTIVFHIQSHHSPGARMVHIFQRSNHSDVPDGIEHLSGMQTYEHCSEPLPSSTGFDELSEKLPLGQQSSEMTGTPYDGHARRRRYRRNKTTISNMSEISPPKRQNPNSIALIKAKERFDTDQNRLFASPDSRPSQKFVIKRKPVPSSMSRTNVGREPEHFDDTIPATSDRTRSPDDTPGSGRARTNSEFQPVHTHRYRL